MSKFDTILQWTVYAIGAVMLPSLIWLGLLQRAAGIQ